MGTSDTPPFPDHSGDGARSGDTPFPPLHGLLNRRDIFEYVGGSLDAEEFSDTGFDLSPAASISDVDQSQIYKNGVFDGSFSIEAPSVNHFIDASVTLGRITKEEELARQTLAKKHASLQRAIDLRELRTDLQSRLHHLRSRSQRIQQKLDLIGVDYIPSTVASPYGFDLSHDVSDMHPVRHRFSDRGVPESVPGADPYSPRQPESRKGDSFAEDSFAEDSFENAFGKEPSEQSPPEGGPREEAPREEAPREEAPFDSPLEGDSHQDGEDDGDLWMFSSDGGQSTEEGRPPPPTAEGSSSASDRSSASPRPNTPSDRPAPPHPVEDSSKQPRSHDRSPPSPAHSLPSSRPGEHAQGSASSAPPRTEEVHHAPHHGSILYGLLYSLAGLVFIAGDVVMSREVVATAMKLRGDIEPWIFAFGIAFIAVLLKPAYDRIIEHRFWSQHTRLFNVVISFASVLALVTLGLLGAFRSQAHEQQTQISRLQSQLSYADPEDVSAIEGELRSLQSSLSDSPFGYWSFILVSLLFAIAGAICLGIGLRHLRDYYHGHFLPRRRRKRREAEASDLKETLDTLFQRIHETESKLRRIETRIRLSVSVESLREDIRYLELEIRDSLTQRESLEKERMDATYHLAMERSSQASSEDGPAPSVNPSD